MNRAALFFSVLFLGCIQTGCVREKPVDQDVALELVRVVGHNARPTMTLEQILQRGAPIEKYGRIVEANAAQVRREELSLVLADRYLAWGNARDAWTLLENPTHNHDLLPVWLELRLEAGLMNNVSEAELLAQFNGSPFFTREMVHELANGKYEIAIQTLLARRSDFLNGPTTDLAVQRWFSYSALVLRMASRAPVQTKDSIHLSEIASFRLALFLNDGSPTAWQNYLTRLATRDETRIQTACEEDIVWILSGAKKLAHDKATSDSWEKMLADLAAVYRKQGNNMAEWIDFVRNETK